MYAHEIKVTQLVLCSSLTGTPCLSTGGSIVTACKIEAQRTNNDDSAKPRPGQTLKTRGKVNLQRIRKDEILAACRIRTRMSRDYRPRGPAARLHSGTVLA